MIRLLLVTILLSPLIAWSSDEFAPQFNQLHQKLNLTNTALNRYAYSSDAHLWGQEDYWATPAEFIARRGGDCEDFAIAKYMALLEAGVPVGQMRMIHVQATELGQAHMVLGVYPVGGGEPLILDNLRDDIVPLSQRPDLEPVYSFNHASMWLGAMGKRVGDASRVRRWVELTQRMNRFAGSGLAIWHVTY